MFLPYSYDIEYDRRPWSAYLLVPLIVGLTVFHLRAFNSAYLTGDTVVMYREGVRIITPVVKWVYLAASAVYLWVFAAAVCAKIGNWIFLLLMLLLLAPLELTWYFTGRLAYQPTSCLIEVMLGMCLFLWPAATVDCFVTLPAKILFSLPTGWIVAFWFFVDVALAFLYRWPASYLLLPSCLLGGFLVAGFLQWIGAAVMDTEDRTMWQILRGEDESDHSWSDTWSARRLKDETQTDQERHEAGKSAGGSHDKHHEKILTGKGK